jgi:uncharacterized protein YraI
MPVTNPTGPAHARSKKPTIPRRASSSRTFIGVCCALLTGAWLLTANAAAAASTDVPADDESTYQSAADQSATLEQESNVRAQPNTSSAILTTLPAGSTITVACWTLGEPTFGNDQHGAMWLYTSLDGWVHSYLVTPVEVPPCGSDAGVPPAAPGQFYEDCDHARAANADPVLPTDPGFGPHLDADNDGIGCEPYE